MRPNAISGETAQRLAQQLQLPIEQIMHMPQHILVQKLMELEKKKLPSHQRNETNEATSAHHQEGD